MMTSFVADYLETVQEQWAEIDILAAEAKLIELEKSELYNALCRSITILIVSHMEGFVKGIVKSIISDYSNVEFKNLPIAVKMTYCKRHLGFDESIFKDYHARIKSLINDFELTADFKVTHEPFLYDKNKNPKPDVLSEVAHRFGVKDIFKNLHDSRFDGVFSMSRTQIKQQLPILKRSTEKKVSEFPYKVRKGLFKTNPKKYNGRSMWQLFLDDLNFKRHKIVHGNDFNNTTDIDTLLELKDKVCILQYSITLIICAELCFDN